MSYAATKLLHQYAVLVSVLGFVLRGSAALVSSQWVRTRLARIIPPLIDTVLLGSAVALVSMRGPSVIHESWLIAKLAGLLAYIALGIVALRPHWSIRTRAVAFAAALTTVGWMISVAITKNPLGFLTCCSA